MMNPQQNALAEALEPFAKAADSYDSCEQHPNGCPDNAPAGELVDLTVGDFRRASQALASNNPAVVEGQGDIERAAAVLFERGDDRKWADASPEEQQECRYTARGVIAALAPAPGQWDNSYHSERTDAVLARMASQHTELAGEAIEVICLLRHEQDRLRNENLTLGARVLELEGADREGV